MKAATVTFFAIALLAAFANAANSTNSTNATLYCGSVNGTSCTTWLTLDACCAVFTGSTKNSTTNVTKTYTTSVCMARALVHSTSTTLLGYTGTYACLNNGMIAQVSAFVVSLGLLSLFA